MKTLKDFNFRNKRALVRVDFNVPLDEQGNILDDFRIKAALPTIEYLKDEGAKIILISHLGQPAVSAQNRKVKSRKQKYTLRPAAVRLAELLKQDIEFLDDCVGEKAERGTSAMGPGDIVLLENLRFHKGEEENAPEFAMALAELADIYVNDAFGACHRAHASIVGVAEYLPCCAGLLLEKEVSALSKIVERPARPLVVVLGGVKISTKIKAIERFLELADEVLLGGKLANTILAGKGVCFSRASLEEETMNVVEKIDLTSPKIHLPVDAVIALSSLKEDYLREGACGTVREEESAFDIGRETVDVFSKIIKGAKTVFWNGPLGYIEDERFANGTLSVASAIARSGAFSLAGGGDTDAFLRKHGLTERFGFVSTGGGAMLSFVGGEALPGLEALKKK